VGNTYCQLTKPLDSGSAAEYGELFPLGKQRRRFGEITSVVEFGKSKQ